MQGFNSVIFSSLKISFHWYFLGKSKEELGENYWDLVVLTASDELQRDAYEKQINDKLKKKEIPSGIPYLVYADPPGPRAGANFYYVRNVTIVNSRKVKEEQTNDLFEPLPFYLKRTKGSINNFIRYWKTLFHIKLNPTWLQFVKWGRGRVEITAVCLWWSKDFIE